MEQNNQNQQAPATPEKQKPIPPVRGTVRQDKAGAMFVAIDIPFEHKEFQQTLKSIAEQAGLKVKFSGAGDDKQNPKGDNLWKLYLTEATLPLLEQSGVQWNPSLAMATQNAVNFQQTVGWLDGVNATIHLGFETLSAGKAKEVAEVLKGAGMTYDGYLKIWTGPVNADNVLALNSLDIDWAQDFQGLAASIGAPQTPKAEAEAEVPQAPAATQQPLQGAYAPPTPPGM
ncbi:MAG: hypothetical protein IBX50_11205 [Marinospirillum sp.]|uniref:hypothetical protein n=1 Tax=Marinospirillum sp. TaxID=2183934 RepID=UPI0019DCB034|nr:hypothetical protein [Marinospirillum sp.]MBE0507265.1 hypothetical protein [Marinospirillum sp.]